MVNPGGHIRKSFFTALNGNVIYQGSPVPVYENEDGKENEEYSIFLKALFTNGRDTAHSFNSECRLNIEVVNERINSASTIDVYAIGNIITDLLTPTKRSVLAMGGDLQMVFLRLENQSELIEGDGAGKDIVRLIMTYYFRVHQTTITV